VIELLQRADPAAGVEADKARIRAKVDERTGMSAPLRPNQRGYRRPWLFAVATFAAVMALTLPIVFREQPSVFSPDLDAPRPIQACKRQWRWRRGVSSSWTRTGTRSG
jgi:hypothetical protein